MTNEEKAAEFCKELVKIMKKHNVTWIGAEVTGDTHGAKEQFRIDVHDETFYLSEYEGMLTPSEIEDCIED